MTGVDKRIGYTEKQKTSFIVDQELWKKWILFVVNRRGSARKLSHELEVAMKGVHEEPQEGQLTGQHEREEGRKDKGGCRALMGSGKP